MIKSFKDKKAKAFAKGKFVRQFEAFKQQWRICFAWLSESDRPEDVEIIDYH